MCRELLTPSEGSIDVLQVLYDLDTPASFAESARMWVQGNGTDMGTYQLVAVGVRPESVSVAGGSLTTVESAGNLAEIGITIDERIAAVRTGDRPFRVCFDGAAGLFENASVQRGLAFVHILTRRLSSADAIAHVHVDPAVIEDSVRTQLAALFDVVIRTGANGRVTVDRR